MVDEKVFYAGELRRKPSHIYFVLGSVARSDTDNIHGVFYEKEKAEEYCRFLNHAEAGFNRYAVYEEEVE